MPYFNNEIHVYGYNQSILWSPFKNRTPKNFTINNFGHPVSKSWLKPCFTFYLLKKEGMGFNAAFNSLDHIAMR